MSLPVPPAIMPRCFAVLITGFDFLSGLIANDPVEKVTSKSRAVYHLEINVIKCKTVTLFFHASSVITFSFPLQQWLHSFSLTHGGFQNDKPLPL